MPVKIAVLKETAAREKRVALVPAVADKLAKLGCEIHMQTGAGLASKIPDSSYKNVNFAANPQGLVSEADIVLAVQPPPADVVNAMKEGAILICYVYAHNQVALVKQLRDRKITCFAMEQVPRTLSRAQVVDALSSQQALTGYYAALLAATHLARIVPMTTTAVGSLRPARAVVLGLGVIGLQTVATLRRLGAVVEATDTRQVTKEQAESLGAKFIAHDVDAVGQGGYARPPTPEEQQRLDAAVGKAILTADIVVTTAAIPGRASPRQLTKAHVESMKPGAVVIDVGAEGGGNCEYTVPGETVEVGQVTVVGPLNIPSMLAEHASELYSKNQYALIELMMKEKALAIDWTEEVQAKMCLTHAGEIKNEAAKKAVEG